MLAVRTFTRTDALPAMTWASWISGTPAEVLGAVAHPGRRVDEHEGEDPAVEGRGVHVDRGGPDDPVLPQPAHSLMGGTRRQADPFAQLGIGPRRVLLKQRDQATVDVIYRLHTLTISCSVIYVLR